ncbi:uncharacterized protein DS421_15g503350 [Arachis hypogaea]|nr:uncharacterized protein DS421_15g503350 [Arachis hypogaea]
MTKNTGRGSGGSAAAMAERDDEEARLFLSLAVHFLLFFTSPSTETRRGGKARVPLSLASSLPHKLSSPLVLIFDGDSGSKPCRRCLPFPLFLSFLLLSFSYSFFFPLPHDSLSPPGSLSFLFSLFLFIIF